MSADGITIRELVVYCDGPTHAEAREVGRLGLVRHPPITPDGATHEMTSVGLVGDASTNALLYGDALVNGAKPFAPTFDDWDRLAGAPGQSFRTRSRFECPSCRTTVEMRIPSADSPDFENHPVTRLIESGLARVSLRLLELSLSRQWRNPE